MLKKLVVLAIILLILVMVIVMLVKTKSPAETSVTSQNQGEETTVEPVVIENQDTASQQIVINPISDMASTKLMVDSREISREDIPSDIRYLADLTIVPLSYLTAYYTKSNYSESAYDVLHDYVLLFFNEDNEQSIRISASKEGNPLRDYFFTAPKELSFIKGVSVNISKYEEKYIVTFSQGRFSFDVETNQLNQDELIALLEEMIK